jgi:hypothetical protein
MGFATNLEEHSLRVFVKSLRRVYKRRECELVIITNDFKPYFAHLSDLGVTFVPTTNNYTNSTGKVAKTINRSILHAMRGLRKFNILERFAPEIDRAYEPLIEVWHHPHFVRWFAYKRFLALNQSYENVLLSDVKDVVFQAPFFPTVPTSKVSIFDQNLKYGEAYWDTKWYLEAFGKRALKSVLGKSAACIGTILGPHSAVLSLASELTSFFSKSPFGRIEQAVFNYLILNDMLKTPYQIVAYDVGPIATLTENLYTQTFIKDGLIRYNKTGEAIPVVHMYDRFSDTRKAYASLGSRKD